MKIHLSKQDKGFALIATISIMALLMLIALAMLSLSAVETKQNSATTHFHEAQANARLALMIAIGDLQKNAGADRRVTAPASILGDSIDKNKRNWTTVWDTSDWDVKNPVLSRDENAYMTALVSRSQIGSTLNRESATAELSTAIPESDPNWIPLVSSGSVSLEDDYVYAESVSINNDETDGSYAYWVGEEGVKARFDIDTEDDHISQTWAKAGRMGIPMGTGIHKMLGMDGYADYLPSGSSREEMSKLIDFSTLDLSSLDKSEVKKHFHHLTTLHMGLLVDNRWGGIRRDLSTAFEMDIDDFGDVEEFNASGEQNNSSLYGIYAPDDLMTNPLYYTGTDDALGYLYEVPVDTSLRYRGPTWDVLRNHYRLYKKERNSLNFRGDSSTSSDGLVAHGVVPFSYNGSLDSLNSSLGSAIAGPHSGGAGAYKVPTVSEYGITGGSNYKAGDSVQPTVQKITPQVIRMILVYGLARDGNEYFLTEDPYFVLHNSYNQPLEFHSLSVELNGMSRVTDFTVSYEEEGTGETKSVVFEVQGGGDSLKALRAYRLKAPSVGNYRLEAGEIKVMSAADGRDDIGAGSRTIRLSELQYNEGSGIYLGNTTKTLNVVLDSILTVKPRLGSSRTLSIFTRLMHPLSATGGAIALDDPNSFLYTGKSIHNHDHEKATLIQQMRIQLIRQNVAIEERQANVNQIPNPEDGALTLYALDIGMKDFSSDVAVMSDFNHRALGFGPTDYDGGDDIAPNWEVKMVPSDLFDLQLVDANSNSYWGEGKTLADGGSSRIVMFDLPYTPSVSLASLQHADTSKYNYHPTYSIANSRRQIGQSDPTKIFNILDSLRIRTHTTPRFQIDTSWASNEALWDRYYFSGMNWGTTSGQPFPSQNDAVSAMINGETDRVLVNPRMSLITKPNSTNIAELKDYTKIGKYLGVSGAFNVNSTSVEAWKAVLASLSGREITYLAGNALTDQILDTSKSALSRFNTPAGLDDDDYAGFRALSNGELESLAEKMVEQVKLRGPFMGLADFVNRRLVDDDTGKSGAIQSAIDQSGINDSVEIGTTNGNRLEQSSPHTNTGMARYLSQGDILTSLAPIIATRSDTFIIRAYGDSKDIDGVIRSRAWCEATVQRIPEWIIPTDEPATVKHQDYPEGNSIIEPVLRQWEPNLDLPETCQTFGRRFKIISFRWLSADEI